MHSPNSNFYGSDNGGGALPVPSAPCARASVGALRDFRDTRNRNRGNNPIQSNEFHALFLSELAVVAALDATPNFVGQLAAPGPKFNAKNNHVN